MPKAIDKTGKRFGKWTVSRKIGGGRPHGTIWLCKCDCGTERPVLGSTLGRGGSTSCGCSRAAEDLTGRKIGLWTVLGRLQGDKNRNITWLCRCACGTERAVLGFALRSKVSKSCGCAKVKHGMSRTRPHYIWMGMIDRCENPNNPAYQNYGGRGIKVCAKWRRSFASFFEDMGPPPANTELDRINNDGNYEPSNCRWSTAKAQANNRRSNRLLTFKGKTQTILAWSREVGLSHQTIQMRLDAYGYSVADALTMPNRNFR